MTKTLYEITGNITDINTLLINKAEYDKYAWKLPEKEMPELFRVSDDWYMSKAVLAISQGFPIIAYVNKQYEEVSWLGTEAIVQVTKWRYVEP